MDSLSWNSLIESREKSAVSDPEKKAEKQRSIKMRMILTRNKSSKVYQQAPKKPRLKEGDESAQFINDQIK